MRSGTFLVQTFFRAEVLLSILSVAEMNERKIMLVVAFAWIMKDVTEQKVRIQIDFRLRQIRWFDFYWERRKDLLTKRPQKDYLRKERNSFYNLISTSFRFLSPSRQTQNGTWSWWKVFKSERMFRWKAKCCWWERKSIDKLSGMKLINHK